MSSARSLPALLALLLVAGAAPLLTGCTADEVMPQAAAYPRSAPVIGETPPSQVGVNSSLPSEPPPPSTVAGQGQDPAAGQDVVVDGEGAPPATAVQDDPAGAGASEYADTDPSALTDFRATLDPYGQWVDDPTYGTAWVPSGDVVGNDFVPYQTAGHWVYDDDYTWVSDYSWGWAPFHYGRWVYAPGYGWEWIPGRTYAGAWVSWRYGWGDWAYLGWAPLGPTWCWRNGYAYGLGFVPYAPYGFVATNNVFQPNLRMALVPGPQSGQIAQHTTPYVPARPTVNGRVAATPRVGGPSPQMLHIPAAQIAHGASANRGVAQAMAFAHPQSAAAMGAHLPQSSVASRGFAGQPGYGTRQPAYGGRMPA